MIMVENMKEVICSSLKCAEIKQSFDNMLYINIRFYMYITVPG